MNKEIEQKYKLLKTLKYYNWMTEEEKNIIFAGMSNIFTTIKKVKKRARCDLVPRGGNIEMRVKINETQEQLMSAFNVSQNVDDFGYEENKEQEIYPDEDAVEDFTHMFQGFLEYFKTALPVMEETITTASNIVNQSYENVKSNTEQLFQQSMENVNQSYENVKSNTEQLFQQSMENVTLVTEHPLFIGSLPLVSASIGSAIAGMIAGEEGKKAIAQSIGSSLGRVAGEQIALSLKEKKTKRTSIKEEETADEDTPSKRTRSSTARK